MTKYIYSFMSLLLLFGVFGITSCDDANPVVVQPVSFQQAVPWSSLANSPWPMQQHDPQNTGRNNTTSLIIASVEWIFQRASCYAIGGGSLTADSLLLVPYEQRGMAAIKLDGTVKWESSPERQSFCYAPIVSSDGTIYYLAGDGLSALNADGTEKWHFSPQQPNESLHLTISQSGDLLFASSGTLYCVSKNGELLWHFSDARFTAVNSLAFSPDGKTLYIASNLKDASVIAVDIISRLVKWVYANGVCGWVLVDAEGNVYVSAGIDGPESREFYFTSLSPDGNVRWKNKHTMAGDVGTFTNLACPPTIDINGNLYFAYDQLISLDYDGNFRWSVPLTGLADAALVSDKSSNIYVVTQEVPGVKILSVYSSGGSLLKQLTGLNENSGKAPVLGYGHMFLPSGDGEFVFGIQ